jgi:hypothetical protein
MKAMLLVGALASALASPAQTLKTDPGSNNPPPAGAILDLNGTPIPGGGNGTYQQYTVDFTATLTNTAITFAFREDPAFISFANASVTDLAGVESPNLLLNGNFDQGTYSNEQNNSIPNSWIYADMYGVASGGVVQSGPSFCYTFNNCWYDGAVQAYDAISQTIPTIVGHTYQISFYLADNSHCSTDGGGASCSFSDLSTNGDVTDTGGNGINATVYAQAGLPASNSSDTKIIQFSPSATPETQIATIGNPTDPAAQSLALTLASVTNAINVSVTFFYEPTDVSTGANGVGIADGVCEVGATEDQDFDCRLAANFTYPAPLLPMGDRLVPHIIPSHNNLGVWVRVVATRVLDGMLAVAGVDYTGPVEWYYAWNTNPSLVTPNPLYIPGWNNLNPQMYDRPGENADVAFITNITTFSNNCAPTCVGRADPGTGGKTKTLNDIVVGAPPNPSGTADTVELLVPAPGRSPFPYLRGLPMLVSFELENESTEKSDSSALTKPHSVSVATLDPSGAPIQLQFPARFPTTFTYSPFAKVYFIFLSPAPYKTDGTVYTLQINSDLFPQPVNVKFVVKKFQF